MRRLIAIAMCLGVLSAGIPSALAGTDPPTVSSATAGTDHTVTCWVKPYLPLIKYEGASRYLRAPGDLKCLPTPPDISQAWIALEIYSGPNLGWHQIGNKVPYNVPTLYHYWWTRIYCPNPDGNRHLFRTHIYGWLNEDGDTDDAHAYSKSVSVSC